MTPLGTTPQGRPQDVNRSSFARRSVYEQQQRMQQDVFGTVALPYYAVITPDGRPVATFLGMTRDKGDFVQFLATGLATLDQP
jgi:hypothetical protein